MKAAQGVIESEHTKEKQGNTSYIQTDIISFDDSSLLSSINSNTEKILSFLKSGDKKASKLFIKENLASSRPGKSKAISGKKTIPNKDTVLTKANLKKRGTQNTSKENSVKFKGGVKAKKAVKGAGNTGVANKNTDSTSKNNKENQPADGKLEKAKEQNLRKEELKTQTEILKSNKEDKKEEKTIFKGLKEFSEAPKGVVEKVAVDPISEAVKEVADLTADFKKLNFLGKGKGLRRNKAGKLIDANGRFVKESTASKIKEKLTPKKKDVQLDPVIETSQDNTDKQIKEAEKNTKAIIKAIKSSGNDSFFDLPGFNRKNSPKGRKVKSFKSKRQSASKRAKGFRGEGRSSSKVTKGFSSLTSKSGGFGGKFIGSAGKTASKSGFKAIGKIAGGAMKAIPGIGTALAAGMSIYDAVDGYQNAASISGKKEKNLTTGDRIQAGASSALSGLTMGLIDSKSLYNGFEAIGNWVSPEEQKDKINPKEVNKLTEKKTSEKLGQVTKVIEKQQIVTNQNQQGTSIESIRFEFDPSIERIIQGVY